MIPFSVKGTRMRKRGDGEGSLKQKVMGGRKVWFARWVEWTPEGIQKRPKKIVGDVRDFPSKREAREELNRIIREATGRLGQIPKSSTFTDIWKRYYALKRPHWSKAQSGPVEAVMRRAILPAIGDRDIADLTHEPIQAALNRMAEVPLMMGHKKQYTRIGYGESALKKARTYTKAVFKFAIGENLIHRNPADNLSLPPVRKPCERFLSMEEVRRLLSAATGRERVTLRLLLVGGLRASELLALRTDDIGPCSLRIDEAVKDRERTASKRRLGGTKTEESDGSVAISPDLEAEVRAWAETRPAGSLLFPTETGTTWRIGNYLKRVLKPLASSVGIPDLTFQCLRRTCGTHFGGDGGDLKDTQTQMRHADAAVTMKHYKKSISERQRSAAEAMDREFLKMAPKLVPEEKENIN